MAIAPGNRSFTSFIQLHSTGTYPPHAQVAIHALHFYRFFIFTGKFAKNPVMNAYINAGILIWFITHINRWKGKQCEQILDIWCMYNSLWKVQKKTERLFLFKCKKIWQDVKTAWRTISLVAEKEENKLDYKELIQTRMFSHVNTDALCLFACFIQVFGPVFVHLMAVFLLSADCSFWAAHLYFQTVQKQTAAGFTECLGAQFWTRLKVKANISASCRERYLAEIGSSQNFIF